MTISSLQDFLDRLEGVKSGGSGQYKALCPAHSDTHHSLSVTESSKKILVHCFKGCPTRDIVEAMGLSQSDLFLDSQDRSGPYNIVETYDYVNADSELVFQVVRTEDKQFPQRRFDEKSRPVWGLSGGEYKLAYGSWYRLKDEDNRGNYNQIKEFEALEERPLYDLPNLLKAIEKGRWVVIVEGEKDVNTLGRKGIIGTTNPQGTDQWKERYIKRFQGAKVAVIPDSDEPGIDHAYNIANSLLDVANTVKKIEFPRYDKVREKHGPDVSDWFEGGGTKEELLDMIRRAPEWKSEPPPFSDDGQLEFSDSKEEKSVKPAREKSNVVTPEELRELTKERKNKNKLDVSINLSLPEAVYPPEGWLPDFMNYSEGVTDANKTLLYAGGLAMLSGTVGKTIALPHFGSSLLYPNLWICTLAPHGRHRKSTVINLVRNLLQKVDAWTILPDEITPEKLISNMNANNSTGVFTISEMASFLSLANRSYQGGFKPMLANWYDVPPKYTKEKITGTDDEKKLVVEKPYITIFGGSTLEWFLESTSPTDVLGGLFSRMIFIPLTERKRDKVHWPEDLTGRENIPENHLIKTLMDRFQPLRKHWQKEGTLTLRATREAKDCFVKWAKEMDKEVAQGPETNKVGGFAERLQTIAKKVAILIEVSQPDFKGQIEKDNPELRLKSMKTGTEFVTEVWRVTRMLIERRFIHDQFAQRMQETLELVYKNGEISRTKLIRTLQIKKRNLDELVNTMQEADFIEELGVKPDGPGRPKKVYVPKGEGG